MAKCLNPFRTGQCLSTYFHTEFGLPEGVLIPFVQGSVFRHDWRVSSILRTSLNPFRTGQCLST